MLLRNCTLIDGSGEDPVQGAIEIDGGLIRRVDRRVGGTRGGQPSYDLTGLTVLPGLIDAHTHLGIVGNKGTDAVPLAVAAAQIFQNCTMALDAGFTTVRDLGGLDGGAAAAIDAGLVLGPRILPSGPIICEIGGNGDLQAPYSAVRQSSQGIPGLTTVGAPCNGSSDVARAARLALRRGATQIKVSATTLEDPPDEQGLGDTELSVEEMQAAVAEATAKGTYVTAHTLNSNGIRLGLAAGIRCFEHGGVSSEAVAASMVEAGAALVPTLSMSWLEHEANTSAHGGVVPVPSPGGTWGRQLRESLAIARAAGILIGLGSDLEGATQDRRGLELVLRSLVESPMAALVAATATNAMIIRRPQLGRVVPGCVADVIAVDGNPLNDPQVWIDPKRVVLVIKDGRVVKDRLPGERRKQVNRHAGESRLIPAP